MAAPPAGPLLPLPDTPLPPPPTLQALTSLYLGFNQLEGPVPPQWTKLTALGHVQRAGNPFLCGSLPPTWTANTSASATDTQGAPVTTANIDGTAIGNATVECQASQLSPPPSPGGEAQPSRDIALLLENAWPNAPPTGWSIQDHGVDYCTWPGITCDLQVGC